MRILKTFGLLALGFVAGAASWSMWQGESAQAQQTAKTRFSVSGDEIGGQPSVAEDAPFAVRYLRDNRTADCYLVVVSRDTSITKAANAACMGF